MCVYIYIHIYIHIYVYIYIKLSDVSYVEGVKNMVLAGKSYSM